MPQFELDAVGPSRYTGRVRGRTPEEAVRRALDLPDEVDIVVADDADVKGWQAVRIEQEESGRVRPHQRMQFRRD